VLDALAAVLQALRLDAQRERASVGLPPAQRRALCELAAAPARSLTELAGRTHTDPNSVSVAVQRLVELGLVTRAAADGDRRRTMLRVTAAGRSVAAEATPRDERSALARALERLTVRDAAAVSRGVRKLARGLAQDGRRS
jgi:DNA-binding MarR family transcriptional regulator